MFYNVNNICKQPTEIGLVVWGGFFVLEIRTVSQSCAECLKI